MYLNNNTTRSNKFPNLIIIQRGYCDNKINFIIICNFDTLNLSKVHCEFIDVGTKFQYQRQLKDFHFDNARNYVNVMCN